MAKSQPDPMRDLMAQVAAQNPRLRARMEAVMDAFFDQVERSVKIGDPATMLAYGRIIIPTMMRSMREGEREAGEDARIAAMRRIMSAVRGDDDADGDDGDAIDSRAS